MKIIEKIEVSLTKEAQELFAYLAGSMFEENADIRKACAHLAFEFAVTHELSATELHVITSIAGIGISIDDVEDRKNAVKDVCSPILAKKLDEIMALDKDKDLDTIEGYFKNFLSLVDLNLDKGIFDSILDDKEDEKSEDLIEE